MKRLMLLCFCTFLSTHQFVRAADLEAGVAVVDITPAVGYRMAGSFGLRVSTGVRDPLNAKALVLRQGNTHVAIVVCDLVGVPQDVANDARRRIEQVTSIPADHVTIAATHSHAGPLFFGSRRDHFHKQAVARDGEDELEADFYPAKLVAGIAQAVAEAKAALRPTELSFVLAEQQGISFNRRFHLRSGEVRFNPGRNNEEVVKVAGPIDPDLPILVLRDPGKDQPRAIFIVFAMHVAVATGIEFSACYPGYMQAALRRSLGDEFVSIFAAGTCGDINHINVNDPDQLGGHEESKRIGEALAATILTALPRAEPVSNVNLAMLTRMVEAPMKRYTKQQIAEAEEVLKERDARRPAFLDLVEAYNRVEVAGIGGETMALEVQAIRLSDDLAMVTLPGEIFVELGLDIKRNSPFARTMVIELSNAAPGYIASAKGYAEGSYETVNSRLSIGGGELLTVTARRLLDQLKP